MKENVNTVLIGSKVILVPYQTKHVPKYHEWMLSEELRTLTASEPLTLEEEFEMQQKWQFDEDKLTFIILARLPSTDHEDDYESLLSDQQPPLSPDDPYISKLPMVGDVNLFLNGTLPSLVGDKEDNSIGEDGNLFEAEVEIMIAESLYRRKGLALEALQLMLEYATGAPKAFNLPESLQKESTKIGRMTSSLKIPPTSLLTRISETNIPSIALFEKLGFKVTKRVEVFGEVEMRWKQGESSS